MSFITLNAGLEDSQKTGGIEWTGKTSVERSHCGFDVHVGVQSYFKGEATILISLRCAGLQKEASKILENIILERCT
jgi:hypothetical protein